MREYKIIRLYHYHNIGDEVIHTEKINKFAEEGWKIVAVATAFLHNESVGERVFLERDK